MRHCLLLGLTGLSVALVGVSLWRSAPVAADGIAPVLRGRGLEIVDERGKVRASIQIQPTDPKVKMPGGKTGYPETVILRLMTAEGRPNVKLAATEIGSGMVLGGEANPTYIQLLSERGGTLVKLLNADSTERVIRP